MSSINQTPFQLTEKKLNSLTFRGMPLGYFSPFFFDGTQNNLYDQNPWKTLETLLVALFKSVGKKRQLNDWQKLLIYHKSGNNRHHIAMEKAVRLADSPECSLLVVGPKVASDIHYGKVYYYGGLGGLIACLAFQVKHRRTLHAILEASPMTSKQRLLYHLHLSVQMLKGLSAKRFLEQQTTLKALCVDYDRNNDACTLIAAAKALHLPTITLQHGILNPPTGYTPLLADQCWAWGDMSKQQLVALGESPQSIINVGTPIIETIPISPEHRQQAKQQHKLKPGKTFLLALSGPNRPLDEALAAQLHAIKTTYGQPDDNFLVKTHPSYKHVDYSWLETKYELTWLPLDIPYADVMNMTDILLSHTSGLGAEALYFGLQVGVIDVPGYDAGSGLHLHQHLGVPLIRKPEDVLPLFVPLDQDKQQARSKRLFYETGHEAALAIAGHLKASVQMASGNTGKPKSQRTDSQRKHR